MKKIYFLGSKEVGASCFNYLVSNRERLGIEIAGVLTNDRSLLKSDEKDSVKSIAVKNEIPLIASLESLLELPLTDLLISVQYHEILTQKHIDKASFAINLHMAPLPEYRGCNQFTFALLDDAKEFGTTLHKLEAGIDSGPILFEKRFEIPQNCFVQELYQLTFDASIELFENSIESILSGNFQLVEQQSLLEQRKASFHLRKEINDVKVIDLSWPKEKIERHIRATWFPPFEPPFTWLDGKKIYFTVAE